MEHIRNYTHSLTNLQGRWRLKAFFLLGRKKVKGSFVGLRKMIFEGFFCKDIIYHHISHQRQQDTQFVNLQKYQWCYYSWHQGQLFVSSNQFPCNQSWTDGCYQASKLWVFSHAVDLYLGTNQQKNNGHNFCRSILWLCTFK